MFQQIGPQVGEWRVRTRAVHTVGAIGTLGIIFHLAARHALGRMTVPELVVWAEAAVALGICMSLWVLPPTLSPSSRSQRRLISSLVTWLMIAAAATCLPYGRAGLASVAHALYLAVTAREICGLPASLFIGTLMARVLLGRPAAAMADVRTQAGLLLLPGPLYPLLCLTMPGQERFLAKILLPAGILSLVCGFVWNREARPSFRRPGLFVALSAVMVACYGPVIRGVATGPEAACLGLAAMVCVGASSLNPVRLKLELAFGADLRTLGTVILAFGSGVALNRASVLLLAGTSGNSMWIPATGIAALLIWTWRWGGARAGLLPYVALAAPLVVAPLVSVVRSSVPGAAHAGAPAGSYSTIDSLPTGRWIEVRTTNAPSRRVHSGAVFDARNRQLVITGSDTHGWDWDMRVCLLDVVGLSWQCIGTPEPMYTYRLDSSNRRIAGAAGSVPWAMHAYGQLAIHPDRSFVWLVSAPLHNHVPVSGGRDAVWELDLTQGRWLPQSLDGPAPLVFGGVAVYDRFRDAVIASAALKQTLRRVKIGEESETDRSTAWEYSVKRREWRSVGDASPHGANVSGVFDEFTRTVRIFERRRSFLVHTYRPGSIAGSDGQWHTKALPRGDCEHSPEYPPVPAVYIHSLGKTLLLPLSEDGQRRTCLFDGRTSVTDLRIPPPPGIGMNYTVAWDPLHECVLLVTGEPYADAPARVWVLKLK